MNILQPTGYIIELLSAVDNMISGSMCQVAAFTTCMLTYVSIGEFGYHRGFPRKNLRSGILFWLTPGDDSYQFICEKVTAIYLSHLGAHDC